MQGSLIKHQMTTGMHFRAFKTMQTDVGKKTLVKKSVEGLFIIDCVYVITSEFVTAVYSIRHCMGLRG